MARKKENPSGGNLAGGGLGAESGGDPVMNDTRSRSESQALVQVVDEGDLRKYRTELPNTIDDLGLDPYEFRLYAHFKRVAGGNSGGACWQSTRSLAEHCRMSLHSVSRAKARLVELGLIEIDHYKQPTTASPTGQWVDRVRIVDIWLENFLRYAPASKRSPHEHLEPERSPGEHLEPKRSPGAREEATDSEKEVTIQSQETTTSASCAAIDDEHVCPTCGHRHDDDAHDLASNEIVLDPEPDDLNDEPSNGATLATVVVDRDSAVIAPAASVEAQAATWALLEAAPDFDDAAGFVAKHGELVGLVACELLTNRDKLDNLRNPAGFVRRAVERGVYPNGSAHALWLSTLASFEAGETPEPEPEPGSYEDLLRRYVPKGYEDIIYY